MTARDDYPLLTKIGAHGLHGIQIQADAALDELDLLRAASAAEDDQAFAIRVAAGFE